MAFSLRPVRLGALLLALLLASIVFAAPAFADDPEADGDAGLSAVVLRSIFTEPDAHLAHNIPNLRVTVGGGDVACNFLSHYETTGGVTRWGFATSEVVEERPGSLTQYYQRGVVDCQERDGLWRMERRLVWDYLGGGLATRPTWAQSPTSSATRSACPSAPGVTACPTWLSTARPPASWTSSSSSAVSRRSAIPRPTPASTTRRAPCSPSRCRSGRHPAVLPSRGVRAPPRQPRAGPAAPPRRRRARPYLPLRQPSGVPELPIRSGAALWPGLRPRGNLGPRRPGRALRRHRRPQLEPQRQLAQRRASR